MSTLLADLDYAARRGVSLVAVVTTDQPAAIRLLATVPERPVVLIDAVRGLSALNDAGEAACQAILTVLAPDPYGGPPKPQVMDARMACDPVTALDFAQRAPAETLVVFAGGNRALAEPRPALAALWLRDTYARNGRQLVALGPSWAPAAELGSDVHVLNDPPPDADERRRTVAELLTGAGAEVDDATLDATVTFTRGLARFTVEQCASLALGDDKSVVLSAMRDRWRDAIGRIPGMQVASDGSEIVPLDEVIGHAAAKSHIRMVMSGKAKPETIVWIDELEKVVTGSATSNNDSGTSLSILTGIMMHMDKTDAEGAIIVGSPGTGKSMMGQAMGGLGPVPVIQLMPQYLKNNEVGGTEANVQRALDTIKAMAGRCYWIATSNGLASMPAELLRRFTDRVWFADTPGPEDREALWRLYFAKYGLTDPIPDPSADRGYAGSDMRNVCRRAARHGWPVADVMSVFAPASALFADRIGEIRAKARGAYLSTSYEGFYRGTPDEPSVAESTALAGGGRRIRAAKGAK